MSNPILPSIEPLNLDPLEASIETETTVLSTDASDNVVKSTLCPIVLDDPQPSENRIVKAVESKAQVVSTELNSLDQPSKQPAIKILTRPKQARKRKQKGVKVDKPRLMIQRPVYLIYSDSPLTKVVEEIKRHIPDDLDKSQTLIGPCRIVFSSNQETDRSICVFNPKIFDQMKKKGLTNGGLWSDFRVTKFELKSNSLPKGKRRHLFIHLPKQLNIVQVKKQLEQELTRLSYFGIVKPNTYRIKIPFLSRDSDDHVGKCYIVWNHKLPDQEDETVNQDMKTSDHDIAITRIILNDSRWIDSEGYAIEGKEGLRRCLWARIDSPKNIKMSPADRAYTHNHQKHRRTKIQGSNRGKSAVTKNVQKSSQKKINKPKFKLDIPEIPTSVPGPTPQISYQPLSAVPQPISIRGTTSPKEPTVKQESLAFPEISSTRLPETPEDP